MSNQDNLPFLEQLTKEVRNKYNTRRGTLQTSSPGNKGKKRSLCWVALEVYADYCAQNKIEPNPKTLQKLVRESKLTWMKNAPSLTTYIGCNWFSKLLKKYQEALDNLECGKYQATNPLIPITTRRDAKQRAKQQFFQFTGGDTLLAQKASDLGITTGM